MAITAQELRIGNLVEVEGKIWAILDSRLLVRIEKEPECANAVPLTAEWLERMGFVTVDYEIDVIEWATEERELDFSITQVGMPAEDQPFIFTYDHGMGDRKIEVKYVHQLQNLFFALTGEELTFSGI